MFALSVCKKSVVLGLCLLFVGFSAASAGAQSSDRPLEVGGSVSVLRLSEFDTTDIGVGVDASWHLMPRLAIDGTLAWYPGSGDGPDNIEDQQRVLGLIGARSGVTRGGVDFYGRARVGFLRFAEQGAVPCIKIFPAPISCQVASGYTAFAFDLGGGAIVPVDAAGRWRVRFDIGDLFVRYGMEGLREDLERTDGFTSHNLLLNVGLIWRF